MDRVTLLKIAGQYEHAGKRLRRWSLLQALKAYLLANFYAVRSGAGGIMRAEAFKKDQRRRPSVARLSAGAMPPIDSNSDSTASGAAAAAPSLAI